MNNPTIDLLMAHRTFRDYTDEPVSDADLDAIVAAAQRAPSSINAQCTSLVVVRDPKKRKKIMEITGGTQEFIAKAPVFICVVADYAKTQAAVEYAGEKQIIHQSLEGFTVGAVDAGLVLMTISTAARALGLGVVMLGSIRNDPQAMIDLLKLPPLTYPIVGCSIGHVASEPKLKPRLPITTFRHDEKYQGKINKKTIKAYDAKLMEYWKSIERQDGLPWSEAVAARYKTVYYPKTKSAAKRQGFKFKK